MKQFLVALVIVFLASGTFAGYLYSKQNRNQPNEDLISRAEAEQMVADAIASYQSAAVPEEEPVAEEPVVEEPPAEEPVAEPVAEEPPAQSTPATEKPKYYRFTVGTLKDDQNIRRTPGGEIVGKAPKGTQGYIVQLGDEWSLVYINGQVEYMATRYLTLQQIKKSEYPKALRGLSTKDAGRRLTI